jgi:hypothetical protein
MVPSAHGAWLAGHCPDAELWLRPDDGHVSVLGSCGVAALDWLAAHAEARYYDEGRRLPADEPVSSPRCAAGVAG